ncbi:restriction endonuclease subunit S [Polaromonas sp. CT11-55]|uniref:restriction endonuclease subunit S n=1 Tax=Polaromonas sp. CT11-55 TaxID=3243045 RepID=UPI0039A6ACBA
MKWPTVRLGTLADFKNGLNFPGTSWGKGLKIIGVSDFGDRSFPDYGSLDEVNPQGIVRDADLLAEGDILFVRSNGNRELIGRSLLIKDMPEPLSHSGFTIRLRFLPEASVCTRFYSHVFKSDIIRKTLSGGGGGTNINNLNQGLLGNLEVPVPPRQEQESIAALLSSYDDLIANNQRRIALLEHMAEEIYREWFSRKRSGRAGHKLLRFDELGRFEKGKNPPELRTSPNEDWLPYLTADVLDGAPASEWVLSNRSVISNAGEVLMLMDGARSGLVFRGPAGVVASTAAVIRTAPEHRGIIYQYLRQMEDAIKWNNTGSAIPHANKDFINRMLVPVPLDEGALTEFNRLHEPLYQQAQALKQISAKLRLQRDSLLPRLISAKLRLDHLDIQYPPSMKAELAKAV